MKQTKSLDIILANDHQILRNGIKATILYSFPQINVLSEPKDFVQLHEQITGSSNLELLITDDVMPKGTIVESLVTIREQKPKLKIIITTMHADIDYIKGLVPYCDGIVSYINIPNVIGEAITTVLNDGIYYTFPGIKN